MKIKTNKPLALIHMPFKSFLVLEPVFIKDCMFSNVTLGNLCSKKNFEIQTYFVLSPKTVTVKKTQTNSNCSNQPVFPLNIVSYMIKLQDFHLPLLIFYFLILKQVIRYKNYSACILTGRTC